MQFSPACNLFLSYMAKYATLQLVLKHRQSILLPHGNNTKIHIHTKQQ
jgi:hypothetical protein